MAADLHDLSTEEIRTNLASNASSPWQKLLLCDVLLARQEEICELAYPFDDLLGTLRREQLSRILFTSNEFTLTTLTRTNQECKRRRIAEVQWFTSSSEGQIGPISFEHMVQWLVENQSSEVFFGESNGKNGCRLRLEGFGMISPFFVKHFRKRNESANNKTPLSPSNSSLPALMGVFQAVSFPFWLVMIFVAIFTGFNTFLGPLLPTVFAVFMVFMCIPMSIGLFLKKRWAWGMLLFTTVFGIVWFGGHVFFDGASKLWLLLAVFEGIILTLALTAKDAFS